MVPTTGRARSFLLVFKNKIERRGRQNKNNRPINLPNVTQTSSTPPNPNLYIYIYIIHNKYIIYIHTYIHTYIFCSSQLLLMIFFFIKMIHKYQFLSVMGVYVVRTSSLNNKHSCQLFRKASSLVLLSSSVSTANLSC